MRVVVGHANPDFDAYASTVAATKLFEGSKGVFLGTQNSNVRAFHNLHEDFLEFVDLRGLDLASITSVVMVDTRDPDRVAELADVVTRPGVEVIVYDHHPHQEGDLECTDDRSMSVGATTSILVHEIRERSIRLSALEASVMLLGIHEDTGSLTYPSATAYDADAAAWLMSVGADIEVLNQFLSRTLDPPQQQLLTQLEDSLELWDINGQMIAVGTASADEYVDSASVLTHYVVEDMGYRVAFGVVQMPERLQVVARSRLAEVDVGAVMTRMGGGGHAQAASAGFRDLKTDEALKRLRSALESEVRPPLRAADIMSTPVRTIGPQASMSEAGDLMAKWGHGGLPVVDSGELVGLVSRKDVDKAVRHHLDHAPVRGFIGKDVVTVSPDIDIADLEQLLASRGIGRVPVMDGREMLGIVTRKDVLRAEHGETYLARGTGKAHPRESERFVSGVSTLVPQEIGEILVALGEVAASRGNLVHVVGGFVRDMLLGRPNYDVDVVVEGDGIGFADAVAARTGARVKVHRRFSTAVLVFSKELHVDVASSRAEYYAKPGALPTVESSSLRQDLFRRDFTINAMSACLDPDCFGAIADPFGGLRDLEARVIRVMHALSFIDDPTRVLRAARFEIRYGFRMDEHTEKLARQAVSMNMLDEVSGARIREELYDILDEPDPQAVFARLHVLGAFAPLLPDGAEPQATLEDIVAVDSGLDTMISPPAAEERRSAFVAAIATSGVTGSCERWLRHFRIGRDHAEAALMIAAHGRSVLKQLEDRRGMRDSRLYRLLSPFSDVALLVLRVRSNPSGAARIDHFATDLAPKKLAVSGRDLIALGAPPSESFSAILAQARDDLLDGRVAGRTAELANLRRLATKAGIIPIAKENE